MSVALITGGHRGIGLGIAHALVAEGFAVALASNVPQDDPEVRSALGALGPAAVYIPHDVADVDGHEALLDRIAADQGPVDCLVSNAGIGALRRGDLLDLRPDSFDLNLAVNLRGAFFLAQAAARRMTGRAGRRSMIFVTSVSAALVSPERAEYCISKAGAAMMAQAFAARLASEGIGVWELRPGIVATGMTAGVQEKYDAAIAGGLVPEGRWGQPADVGAVAAALAAGRLPFSTGATIPVDGGLSIHRL